MNYKQKVAIYTGKDAGFHFAASRSENYVLIPSTSSIGKQTANCIVLFTENQNHEGVYCFLRKNNDEEKKKYICKKFGWDSKKYSYGYDIVSEITDKFVIPKEYIKYLSRGCTEKYTDGPLFELFEKVLNNKI